MERIIRLLGPIVVALAIATSILDSDPTASGLDMLGTFILEMAVFAVCVGLIVFRAWRQPEFERLPYLRAKRSWWLPLSVVPAGLILSGLGVFQHARFAISKPKLLAAASPPRIGIKDAWPRRIGLYLVYEVTREETGVAIFDLGGCGFLDHCWFVFDPRETAAKPLAAVWEPAPQWWFIQDPF